MGNLTKFLAGVYSSEHADEVKTDRSTCVTVLLQMANRDYAFVTNQLIVEMRDNCRLRVVQQLQASCLCSFFFGRGLFPSSCLWRGPKLRSWC